MVRGVELFTSHAADGRPLLCCASLGYLPRGGVLVGLSKAARIADVFARRLQTPAALAADIAARPPPQCLPLLLFPSFWWGIHD